MPEGSATHLEVDRENRTAIYNFALGVRISVNSVIKNYLIDVEYY